MIEKILPIGSVVLLKNGTKKLVITGIKPMATNEPQTVYDYIGVLYPEGYLGNVGNYLFNHVDITDVVFRGYDNPEWKEFVSLVEQSLEKEQSLTSN